MTKLTTYIFIELILILLGAVIISQTYMAITRPFDPIIQSDIHLDELEGEQE